MPTLKVEVMLVGAVIENNWGPAPHVSPEAFRLDPLSELPFELLLELLLLFEFEPPPEPGTVPEPPSARTGVAQPAPKMPKPAIARMVIDIRTNRALLVTRDIFISSPQRLRPARRLS